MPRGSAHLALVASAVLFGAMAVVARVASTYMPNGQLVLLRNAIGLSAVLAWGLTVRGAVRPVRWRLLAVRGLLGGAAAYLYFEAIADVGAGTATLLNFTSPVYAAMFAALFLGEHTTTRLWIGLAMALSGMLLVVGAAHLGLSWGVLAGAGSAILGGAAVTSIRALRATDSAAVIFGSFSLFGLLIAAPVAATRWTHLGPAAWGWALAAGSLALVAQMLFTHALGFVRAAEAAVLTQLTPVSSVAIAAVFLHEPVSPRAAIGVALVVAGVTLAAVRGVEPEPAPPPES